MEDRVPVSPFSKVELVHSGCAAALLNVKCCRAFCPKDFSDQPLTFPNRLYTQTRHHHVEEL